MGKKDWADHTSALLELQEGDAQNDQPKQISEAGNLDSISGTWAMAGSSVR